MSVLSDKLKAVAPKLGRKGRYVSVDGRQFPVQEHKDGTLKAHLFDILGPQSRLPWSAVYATSYPQLTRRIRYALERD